MLAYSDDQPIEYRKISTAVSEAAEARERGEMTDALALMYNSFDPDKPAKPEYYLDCSRARGSSALVERFLSHLYRSDEYLCFLFSGHIGCGKSSELQQLKHALANPAAENPRYFPVLVNVGEYLDDFDAAPSDIFLAIVSELASALREELGIELRDNYFVKRINEIKQFFLSDVEVREGELGLGGAKLKIQRLKRDPGARDNVRQALEPKLSTMAVEINTVFEEARLKMRSDKAKGRNQSFADFVLILDDMEKIVGFPGKQVGIASQREFFIERAPQLRAIKSHVIHTVPLRLARSDGPQLKQRYGVEPFVLPMVKIFERGTTNRFAEGHDCIRRLLQRRLGELDLNKAFDPEALEFLIQFSGGHVKNLMTFLREACTHTKGIPIPLQAAKKAVQLSVRAYSTGIPEQHWEKLAQLDQSADQQIRNGDEDYLLMLEQLSILEYVNGGGDAPFTGGEPWYAVNPIVKELQKFKAAEIKLLRVN